MSAYACEPDKGSEPEVGWQWALQMSRFHDVTVVTRANNRENIERKLAELKGAQPLPEFIYHEESRFLQRMKHQLSSLKLYYVLWQRSARELVAALHAQRKFDLLHHVTFAGFRYPTAIWGHGAPCIWGPIGGIESVPWRLLPWGHPPSLFAEFKRNIHNLLQSAPLQVLPKRARASTVILSSTPEMQDAFKYHGFHSMLMPTIGLKTQLLPYTPLEQRQHDGPLRLLFVGNIITLKGVDLALHALKESGTNATFTLIGSGNYEEAGKALVQKYGLEKQVTFAGRISRREVLERFGSYDVFLFPSLHDTGGYAVIEAMFNALPVICLDCGGPAVAVRDGCGLRVPTGSKSEVISGLADAIRKYASDRNLVRAHGIEARKTILENYDWDKKGAQMNEVYQKAARPDPEKESTAYTGISSTTHVIHRVVSVKGLVAALAILFLIGALGFMSLSRLKNLASQIVGDTLPRLSLAGQANAYIADTSRTVMFIFAETPEKRAEIRQDIESVSDRTTGYLNKYADNIEAKEERELYENLLAERKTYISIRDHVLDLAQQGRREEAINEYTESLLPAHSRVKAWGDRLYDSDIKRGELRSQRIMVACTLTQITVALIGVVVFVIGFFIGLFR